MPACLAWSQTHPRYAGKSWQGGSTGDKWHGGSYAICGWCCYGSRTGFAEISGVLVCSWMWCCQDEKRPRQVWDLGLFLLGRWPLLSSSYPEKRLTSRYLTELIHEWEKEWRQPISVAWPCELILSGSPSVRRLTPMQADLSVIHSVSWGCPSLVLSLPLFIIYCSFLLVWAYNRVINVIKITTWTFPESLSELILNNSKIWNGLCPVLVIRIDGPGTTLIMIFLEQHQHTDIR